MVQKIWFLQICDVVQNAKHTMVNKLLAERISIQCGLQNANTLIYWQNIGVLLINEEHCGQVVNNVTVTAEVSCRETFKYMSYSESQSANSYA